MNFHEDERHSSFYDIFGQLYGQINVAFVPPGSINTWHSHSYNDAIFIIKGKLKVGIVETNSDCSLKEVFHKINPIAVAEVFSSPSRNHYSLPNLFCTTEGVQFKYLSDKGQRYIKLPHQSFHGYKNIGHEEAILVYYLDKKWSPEDDYKLPIGTFGESW